MSAILLVEDDLLVDISREELDGLTNELLAQGQADPVATQIADALGVVQMYVDPWALKTDVLKRLWRLLAIAGIYNRLSRLPEKRKEERDWAMMTLKEVRDGKFPNLLIDQAKVEEAAPMAGRWGSAARVNFGSATRPIGDGDDL